MNITLPAAGRFLRAAVAASAVTVSLGAATLASIEPAEAYPIYHGFHRGPFGFHRGPFGVRHGFGRYGYGYGYGFRHRGFGYRPFYRYGYGYRPFVRGYVRPVVLVGAPFYRYGYGFHHRFHCGWGHAWHYRHAC